MIKISARVVVVLLATAVIGYGSVSTAFVRVVALANPRAALAIQADDPIALAASADILALSGVTPAMSTEMSRLAVASLKAQALNPRALRLLASAPDKTVSPERRAAILALSHRLSRREVGTQLLLIEKNVQADDVKQTLKHYNYALTTDEGSWATLFPILSAAIEDPSINREFSGIMQSSQPWVGAFIRFKLEQGDRSNALVKAANAASVKPDNPDFDDLKQYLFEQSVATGNFGPARVFYERYRVAEPDLLQSTRFVRVAPDSRVSKLQWRLTELPYILPQIDQQAGSSRYNLSVSGSASARGIVATKLLMLAPGTYQIDVDYGDVEFTRSSFGTWVLKCMGIEGSPVIWTKDFTDAKHFRSAITIPGKCEAQTIELAMTAGPASQESVFIVRSVTMKKLK